MDPVVLIHRERLYRLLAVFSCENQLIGGRDHGSRLINAVLLREVEPASDGEYGVNVTAVYSCYHVVIAVISVIAHGQINAQGLKYPGRHILYKARDVAVLIRVAVGQVMGEIAHFQLAVGVHPVPLHHGKGTAEEGIGIILLAQCGQVVGLLRVQHGLGPVQLLQQVRP